MFEFIYRLYMKIDSLNTFIAPGGWLRHRSLNPVPSMLVDGTWTKLKSQNTHRINVSHFKSHPDCTLPFGYSKLAHGLVGLLVDVITMRWSLTRDWSSHEDADSGTKCGLNPFRRYLGFFFVQTEEVKTRRPSLFTVYEYNQQQCSKMHSLSDIWWSHLILDYFTMNISMQFGLGQVVPAKKSATDDFTD